MLCRLFCKHAKQCKRDMETEEREAYELLIANLEKELDLATKNVRVLTETLDAYEKELHETQIKYNKLLEDYNLFVLK